jgi:hypothetical protein
MRRLPRLSPNLETFVYSSAEALTHASPNQQTASIYIFKLHTETSRRRVYAVHQLDLFLNLFIMVNFVRPF